MMTQQGGTGPQNSTGLEGHNNRNNAAAGPGHSAGPGPDAVNAPLPTATGWPGKAPGGSPGAVGPDPTVAGRETAAVGSPNVGTTGSVGVFGQAEKTQKNDASTGFEPETPSGSNQTMIDVQLC